MQTILEFPDSDGYGLVHCPFCGHIENLDWQIEDNWECEGCKREFFITPCRMITAGIPTMPRDGRERYTPIAIQIVDAPNDFPIEGEHGAADINNG